MDNNVIVIGASAGGIESLFLLVRDLPGQLSCPICVVIHLPSSGSGNLPKLISKKGNLVAQYAQDGESLIDSRIYLAPPDSHFMVMDRKVHLDHGPRENGCRPAVDPLFRSAASEYGAGTIGVILSGALDDGTAGLAAIKSVGGIAIVQDPKEALFDGMPSSAISNVDVDIVTPISKMSEHLIRLCNRTTIENKSITIPKADNAEFFVCPECGGPLKSEDEPISEIFECMVGHSMTANYLWDAQSNNIEKILWTAVRALRERANLADRMSFRFAKHQLTAKKYIAEANLARQDAQAIEDLIVLRERRVPALEKAETSDAAENEHAQDDAGEIY